jgi:archaellum component FlaC
LQSNGHIDNTTKEDSEFEPSINEPHEGVPVVDDEQLRTLPENEEEKEEILLPTTVVKTTKPKVSSNKRKSSLGRRRRDETNSAGTTKQLRLQRQATQLDKITIMLHSIQKDMKSTKGQSKLINQLRSQIKQLRTQMSQIQKNIAKRNSTAATISSRKKMLRPKKR